MQKKKILRRRPLKTAKLGGSTITIQDIDKPPYLFAVIMRQDGKRVREKYARTKGEAESLFQLWTTEAANTGTAATGISDQTKRAILDFEQAVAGWTKPPTVAQALRVYVEAHRTQGVGFTVTEAAQRHLESVERRKLSKRHIDGTRVRLDRFTADHGDRRLSAITSDELDQWLHGLSVSPVTMQNFKLALSPLFKDALERGEITRNPLASIRMPKASAEGQPEVFTPAEVRRLLETAPDSIRAVLAIGLFAGLRRAEILRLQWDRVDFDAGHLEVTAGTAKTASRRLVTMSENLKAWLRPLAMLTGPVAPKPDAFRYALDHHIAAIGITWKDNGLRHSFISYLVAINKDAAKTAEQAGNSPAMIHKHYRALVGEKQAQEYFAIMPPSAGKIVRMPRAQSS